MKRMYIALFLLSSTINLLPVCNGRVLNADIIHEIDGKFLLKPVIDFWGKVQGLLEFNYGANGKKILLQDLAAQESQLDKAKMELFLKKCIFSFFEMINNGSYLKIFHMIHPIFDELVEAWGMQSNKKASPFYRFAKSWRKLGSEQELLTEQVTSLSEYVEFLRDFEQFLADVTVSFPVSYASYQASRSQG